MKLIIDSRECGVIQVFKNKKLEGEFETESMPVGDFMFKEGDTKELIIERKTYDDLAASIIDGRFREQRGRLVELKTKGMKIMYIIEGNVVNYRKSKVPYKTLVSAILNLMLVHDCMVMFSGDTCSTVDILMLLKEKLGKTNNNVQAQPLEIKMPSKGDKIRENLFLLQMMVIPGVSQKSGEMICSRYNNISKLVEAFKEDGEELLADIQVTDKRKLGKALSRKIFTALMQG